MPSGSTKVERRAIRDAASNAGAAALGDFSGLVHHSGRRRPQSTDFILEVKLASLELYNSQVVGGEVGDCVLDLALQGFVLTLELGEMRVQRHQPLPPVM